MATARHKEATKKRRTTTASVAIRKVVQRQGRATRGLVSPPQRGGPLYHAICTCTEEPCIRVGFRRRCFLTASHTHLHTERRSGKHYNSSWQLTSNSRSCDVHISDVVVTGWAPVSTVPLWVFYYSQLPHLVNALSHSGTHTAKSTRPYHIAPHWLYAA